MINIIPKPYQLTDYDKSIIVSGFNYECPIELESGLEVLKEEFNNSGITVMVSKKYFHNDDAYSLEVTEDKVFIEAKNARGVFYATRSLKQLINIVDGKLQLQMCKIFDKPKMMYRSFSFDESRHFFGLEETKKIIDILGLLKVKYLHWHLSDDQGFRVNFKKFPRLYEVGSKRNRTLLTKIDGDLFEEKVYQYAYTEEEVLEIIEYAKKRFINITPEFDVPGHTASFVASYPYLHCLGKETPVFERFFGNADIMCPSKETTYEFLTEFFEEVMRLFKDSEYIHLGGDEVLTTVWEECEDCKNKMKELGTLRPLDLQAYFNQRFIDILKPYNKKMIMWGEGVKDTTDSKVILQYWTWQMIDEIIQRINDGRNSIYSPCSQLYFDAAYVELPLKTTYGRGIVLKNLTTKGRGKIFGMECCVWTEFIRTNDFLEFMIFPRIHAFSESAWTHKKDYDYDSFKERLAYHYAILDSMGMKYAKPHVFDESDPGEEISKIFRNENRFVEYDKN